MHKHPTCRYLWFWAYKSVPELYYSTVTAFNPEARLLVLTDDAHSLRNRYCC
jgi:hypothetical protein